MRVVQTDDPGCFSVYETVTVTVPLSRAASALIRILTNRGLRAHIVRVRDIIPITVLLARRTTALVHSFVDGGQRAQVQLIGDAIDILVGRSQAAGKRTD